MARRKLLKITREEWIARNTKALELLEELKPLIDTEIGPLIKKKAKNKGLNAGTHREIP